MQTILHSIGLRILAVFITVVLLSQPQCYANGANEEPNVKELALAFTVSLQIASLHFEQGEKSGLKEKRLQAEILVARIFRLWMSERKCLGAYPKDFFKGVRHAMGDSLRQIGIGDIYKDPLRSVIISYKKSPIINQEFGRVPDVFLLSDFIEKPELYQKYVLEFMRELGLDAAGNVDRSCDSTDIQK